MKGCPHHQWLAKRKSNPQWDEITYSRDWPKSKRPPPPCIYEDREKVEPLCVTGGKSKRTDLLGKQIRSFFQKVEKKLTIEPIDSTLRTLTKRSDHVCPYKGLWRRVHHSVIYNNPKLQTIQVSPNWQQNGVYLYNRILGIVIKNVRKTWRTKMNLRNITLW